jgi:ATP-dependent Zn protease
MTKETKKYQVHERHQLIDLNQDHINFQLKFECEAVDPNIPFHMYVTNQQELDSTDISSLPLKKITTGKISGNIVADNNISHNYFLILSAPQSCEILVTIELEPIQAVLSSHENDNQNTLSSESSLPPTSSPSPSKWNNLSQILFWALIIILILIAFYLFFFSTRQKQEISSTIIPTTTTQSHSIIDNLNNNL